MTTMITKITMMLGTTGCMLQVIVPKAGDQLRELPMLLLLLLLLLLPLLTTQLADYKVPPCHIEKVAAPSTLVSDSCSSGRKTGGMVKSVAGGKGTGKLGDEGDSAAVHPDIASADGSRQWWRLWR